MSTMMGVVLKELAVRWGGDDIREKKFTRLIASFDKCYEGQYSTPVRALQQGPWPSVEAEAGSLGQRCLSSDLKHAHVAQYEQTLCGDGGRWWM